MLNVKYLYFQHLEWFIVKIETAVPMFNKTCRTVVEIPETLGPILGTRIKTCTKMSTHPCPATPEITRHYMAKCISRINQHFIVF